MMLATIDWHTFFFVLFSLVACVFGAGVLFTSNIVRMAFCLVISLGATAGLFFLAGAEFVGAMQIMIYVGGTLVLLVFGVMLTAQKSYISMKTRGGEWVVALAVGGGLLLLLVVSAFLVPDWREANPDRGEIARADVEDTARIGQALVGVRVDKLDAEEESDNEGLSGYMLPFEIASVHLLVVLIGAGYLARTKRRSDVSLPAASETRDVSVVGRQRGVIVSLVLAAVLLSNLLIAILFMFVGQGVLVQLQEFVQRLPFASELGKVVPRLDEGPDWFVPTAVVLAGFGAFCAAALLGWQRWGFYGLAAAALLEVVAVGAAFGPVLLGGQFVASAVMVGFLYVVLRVGRERSVWAQLD